MNAKGLDYFVKALWYLKFFRVPTLANGWGGFFYRLKIDCHIFDTFPCYTINSKYWRNVL